MKPADCTEPSVYRPRTPQTSPLYGLLRDHFLEFEQAYAERYAERYGPWRPALGRAVTEYLKSGIRTSTP